MDENTEITTNENQSSELPKSRSAEKPVNHRNSWIFGLIMAAAGVVLLIQNTTSFHLDNWEPLLLLIPAAALLGRGLKQLKASGGRFNQQVRGSFIVSFVFFALAGVLFFELDTEVIGPLLAIVIGLAIMANSLLPKD